MSAAIAAPAMAGGISNPTITGNDYYLYDVNGTQTFLNPHANLADILQGDSNSPGGNLELFASSETQAGLASFVAGATTSVSGIVGGQTLTLSSLNASDWFSKSGGGLDYSYGANTLATEWFTQFYNNAVTGFAQSFAPVNTAFDAFRDAGGFAAGSDPNISYAYNDGNDIKIGLAGHYDLKAFYQAKLASTGSVKELDWLEESTGLPAAVILNLAINDGFQASEVVKYTYNGNTDYLYSFNATNSGLLETDGWSHNGNYEVKISGDPEAVPEPITGLIAAAGLGGAALRRTKKSKKS
jgi:hypothetical protein